MRPNSGMFVYSPPVVSVNEAAPANPAPSSAPAAAYPSPPSTSNGVTPSSSGGAWSKEQEAAAAYEQPSAPAAPVDTPPNYTNLFPQLPK